MYEEALQIAEKRREVKGKGERERYTQLRASMVAQMIKNLPTMQETRVQSLGWEDPLEKGKATLSSILAWRSHEQRSLVGYSVWGCRKSDMAEQLSTQTHTHSNGVNIVNAVQTTTSKLIIILFQGSSNFST